MKRQNLLLLGALVALAGCVVSRDSGRFTIPSDEIRAAWGDALYREMAKALEDGIEPIWAPVPTFSEAQCRWIRPGAEAMCRYAQCSRLGCQPRLTGSEPERRVTRTAKGWDLGF